MLPTFFISIEEIPLTRNGKVDRSALAAPGIARESVDLEYVAPRTPVEQRLVSIWSQVLGLDRIGIHDNFFRLGGHSLLAAQVIARIAQDLHVELPVSVLFDRVTVEDLAAAVVECQLGRAADDADLADILSAVEAMTEDEANDQLIRP
jgi:acyl carrier protein